MTRSRFVFSSKTHSHKLLRLSLPPSLEQRSVSQKKHLRETKLPNRKSLAKESNGALMMRKCFAAVGPIV